MNINKYYCPVMGFLCQYFIYSIYFIMLSLNIGETIPIRVQFEFDQFNLHISLNILYLCKCERIASIFMLLHEL